MNLAVYSRLFIICSLQIRPFPQEFALVYGFSGIFSIKTVMLLKNGIEYNETMKYLTDNAEDLQILPGTGSSLWRDFKAEDISRRHFCEIKRHEAAL